MLAQERLVLAAVLCVPTICYNSLLTNYPKNSKYIRRNSYLGSVDNGDRGSLLKFVIISFDSLLLQDRQLESGDVGLCCRTLQLG